MIKVMAMARRMREETERLSILRVTEQGKGKVEDIVVRESSLTIVFNDQELVTLLCSPQNRDYLAIGFLLSEGLIKSKEAIKKIIVDDQQGLVRVEAEMAEEPAAQPQSKRKVESDIEISASEVLALMDEFSQRSKVFKATGGVHSAALCDTRSILVFSEDIGRHNAIDKVFGQCLLEDIATAGRLMLTSGRLSSEIVLKVARRNVPLLISKAAPTDRGVKLATDLGITLIGFARGKKMNIYTNERRLRDG